MATSGDTETFYNSPKDIQAYLSSKGYGMQKKFGQNFLIDQHARQTVANNIIATIDDNKASEQQTLESGEIWEIGPGLGSITSILLQKGASVKVFEIDKGFVASLKEIFANDISHGHLEIVEGNVLKTFFPTYIAATIKPLVVFGNLPYNIGSVFIARTIEQGLVFRRCVYTLQAEVAQRLLSKPGSKDYSNFCVLVNTFYNVKRVATLSREAFFPKPMVSSSIIVLTAKDDIKITQPCKYARYLKNIFLNRRKTLLNNLVSAGYPQDRIISLLNEASLQKSTRSEELSIAKIIDLYMRLQNTSVHQSQ